VASRESTEDPFIGREIPIIASGSDHGPALLARIARRIDRLLARHGLSCGPETDGGADGWTDDAPVLAGLAAASVQGVGALGARAGVPTRRWGDAIDLPEARDEASWRAHGWGFDLHAGVRVAAKARDRLERLCRYALRPAVGQTRLLAMPDGTFVLELPRRWRDGTTHLIFDPMELLERLAVLVPRPRVHLILYHGVLAPRAAWRRAIVPAAPPAGASSVGAGARLEAGRRPNATWAALMQRGFGFDVLACPRCGGRLRLVALIQAPAVIERILRHLGLPEGAPAPRPSRAPPLQPDWNDIAVLSG